MKNELDQLHAQIMQAKGALEAVVNYFWTADREPGGLREWDIEGLVRGAIGALSAPPAPAAAALPEAMLQRRIKEMAERHGSIRAAARVLMVDHAYLYRLSTGEKDDPGEDLLRKLKLRRVVTFEDAAQPKVEAAVAIPEGMVLVPKEPTTEMLDAGAMRHAMNMQYVASAETKAKCVYRDMLAAAPQPTSAASGRGD